MSSSVLGSARDAAATIAAGEASSRELTEAVLRRIEAVNPRLNAVVELRAEEALREAEQADRAGPGARCKASRSLSRRR
jgi:amidase